MLGFIGGIVGGLINKKSQDKANAKNVQMMREGNQFTMQEGQRGRKWATAEAEKARAADAAAADKKAAWDRSQVLDARKFDVSRELAGRKWEASQAREQRAWSAEQTVQAEARQRGYLDEDRAYAEQMRDEDRAYADPAAVRARLEAAGFNPLSGVDQSAGIGSSLPAMGAANIPMGANANAVSAAQSGVAEMMATQAGIASSGIGQSVTPATMQATDFGSAIADSFANFENYQLEQAEYALRKSQVDVENKRIASLINSAQQKPSVDGVYSQPSVLRQSDRSTVTNPAIDSVSRINTIPGSVAIDKKTGTRPPGPKPLLARNSGDGTGVAGKTTDPVGRKTESLYINVFDDTTGRTVTVPNPDLDLGFGEMATTMLSVGAADLWQNSAEIILDGRAKRAEAGWTPEKMFKNSRVFGPDGREIQVKPQRNIQKGR